MEKLRENILRRLIQKGGLYGLTAKHFAGDDEKGSRLIVECFEQCHHQESQMFWGKDLVRDIVDYRFSLLADQRRELRVLLEKR